MTQQNTSENNGCLYIGVFIGGILGAISSLWYLPKSGDDMRAELMDNIDGSATIDESLAMGKEIARQNRLNSDSKSDTNDS